MKHGKHLNGRPITDEEMRDYEIALQNHNNWCDRRIEEAEQLIEMVNEFGPETALRIRKDSLEQVRSMDAPNRPG